MTSHCCCCCDYQLDKLNRSVFTRASETKTLLTFAKVISNLGYQSVYCKNLRIHYPRPKTWLLLVCVELTLIPSDGDCGGFSTPSPVIVDNSAQNWHG